VRADDLTLVELVSERCPRHVGEKVDDDVCPHILLPFAASIREHLLQLVEGAKPFQALPQAVHLRKRAMDRKIEVSIGSCKMPHD